MRNVKKANKYENGYPQFYAAFSRSTEAVLNSSSGGIFYEMAREIINNNGVVFGAAWESVDRVKHIYVDNLSDIHYLQKSKYIRSDLADSYQKTLNFLNQGRHVLFSGTPCQIAGLYQFLKRDYDTLFTVEVVCHGIPIKQAYLKYLEYEDNTHGERINSIDFRDKRNGWENNYITEYYSNFYESTPSKEHLHHDLYLKGINMEKGCGNCRYAKLPRCADVTLADFWGYRGRLYEAGHANGISLVCINNHKGKLYFDKIQLMINFDKVELEDAVASCRHLTNAPQISENQKAFEKMIKQISFNDAASLCSKFGKVELADELTIMDNEDINEISRVFLNNTNEIIYINYGSEGFGIITFGVFIENFAYGKNFVNKDFKRVSIEDAEFTSKIQRIFDENKKINRIPIMNGNKIEYEVRRLGTPECRKDNRRILLPFIRALSEKKKCYFFKRPDYLTEYDFGEEKQFRIDNHLSFPVLFDKKDEKEYQWHLSKLLNDKYSDIYINGLCDIPPIIKRGNRYCHKDKNAALINVCNGLRRTCNQPDDYKFTIHMYGRCGVFGYAVEDSDTLPSKLQSLLLEYGVRVINHSTWGAEDDYIIQNFNEDLIDGVIESKDIIVFYMNYLPNMEDLRQMGVVTFDTTELFYDALAKGKADFYDIPGHMNAEGYEIIAEYIFNEISGDIKVQLIRAEQNDNKKRNLKGGVLDKKQKKDVDNYTLSIKRKLPSLEGKKVGAVVMNCNPFTLGHRYLVEKAKESVDVLIVFVVQEDNSIFSFLHRFEMVSEGIKDLEDVYVFPSGCFIISAYTLPDYVFKKQTKSTLLDMNLDVEIFAQYICPPLNIQYRFVGTEPADMVTAEYNITLKRILGLYGIELIEIERLSVGEEIISAKKVREKLDSGYDVRDLSCYLPASTIRYISKNGMR